MTYTGLSPDAVTAFKVEHCDENAIISELLRNCFGEWVADPILDVGAGSGDVTAAAFPNRRVVQLDRFFFPSIVQSHHERVIADYFEFASRTSDHFSTVLFCHVTQYLDDDPQRLIQSIEALNPERVLSVTNDNDGVLGQLVEWGQRNLVGCNPEVAIPGFLLNYVLERSVSLTATLHCTSFEELTNQAAYLLDTSLATKEAGEVEAFLRSRLETPALPINQTVKGYYRAK